jgi:2,3-bisphosphoglycerate-independent phosphoglycerate mutase
MFPLLKEHSVKTTRPVILTIMDGWGHSEETRANAVALAKKPTFDHLMATYPHTLINTSGPFVGLPDGQMGNSEVGHMNLGAGRVLLMDVTKIDVAIDTGKLGENPRLAASMAAARGRRLHLMGLVSDGGVHSHINHLIALLRLAKQCDLTDVCVHVFTDGRDTPPESGAGFVEQLERAIAEIGVGRIATVSGRYYSMDRDKRWERTERGFNCMVKGDGAKFASAVEAIRASYAKGVTDEFIEPITIVNGSGEPVGLINDRDVCIFFNFRADRGRQMTRALTDPAITQPPRSACPKDLHFTTMTQYDATIPVPVAFPPEQPVNILADVMQGASLKNLRCAETEKYPHVTFYFNGGNEKPYTGEERVLIPSPKVATYDLQPEMSAAGITGTVVKAIEDRTFDVIIMNYANGDMVGHSGKLEPTIRAIETVDAGLARIYAAIQQHGGAWLVTADHGNAETMIDPATGGPHTYHTTNPVPLIYVADTKLPLRPGGSLRDIAPTMLGMLGIPKPAEMTGQDLRVVGD